MTARESSSVDRLRRELAGLNPRDTQYATQFVDRMLELGREAGASDLHLQPVAEGLELRCRVDGVLQLVGSYPAGTAANVVARLKVLANLLTYRTDAPQEGRIRSADSPLEMRVSTFPTLFGEKAVVRIFAGAGQYLRLDDLGMPPEILATLRHLMSETSGAVLVTGPAGSGKTTTVYACLREIVGRAGAGRSMVSLEDPIEVAVSGVAQSQVNASVGFDLANGLRFLMRQDPEVIMVGEIRDRVTAEAAFQASLTGHLLLSTFHAGSAAGAVSRLSDMGIEPYLLRSGLLGIVCQRLARKLCTCSQPGADPALRLGLEVEHFRVPVGCQLCGGTGYLGRFVLAEMLTTEQTALGRAILSRSDAARLEQLAVEAGMVSRWQRAREAIASGMTSPAEIRRVLGFSDRKADDL